jgi:DNA-binding SARP family transcriptional activator
MMAYYRIRLLGEVSIVAVSTEKAIELPGKAVELLFFLLLHAHKPHHRESLAAQLWPEATAVSAAKYFRQLLWRLQSAMNVGHDAPLLLNEKRWVRLNPAVAVWSDAAQLAASFAQVRNRAGADLAQEQFLATRRSIAHYQGDLLPGWYQTWCLIERERYRSIFLALIDKLMGYCLANGRFDEGVQYGLTMLHHDVTREKTHRGLMRLYSLSGDRSSALRQYEQCKTILAQELEVTPTVATRQLYRHILEEKGATPAPAPPSPTASDRFISAELAKIKTYLQAITRELEGLKAYHQVDN